MRLLATSVSVLFLGLLGAAALSAAEDTGPLTDVDQANLFRGAREAIVRGNVDEARKEIKSYCDANPDSAHPEILLASLLLEARQNQLAVTLLNRLSLDQALAYEAHFAFARIAFAEKRSFDAWAHASIADQASPPTRWSQEFNDKSRYALNKLRSLIALQRNDWPVAFKLLAAVADENPDDPETTYGLGIAAFHTGNLQVAQQALERAATLDPSRAPPQLELAKLFRITGDQTKADELIGDAIAVAGRPGQVSRLTQAEWLLASNRSSNASETLENHVTDADLTDQRDYLLGLAHRMRGEFDAAEKLFSKLHRADSVNVRYSNQLALVLIESEDEGKRARALQIASTNLERARTADTVSTAGWIRYRLGDPARAEELLNAVVRSGTISRDCAYYLSQVKRSLGKTGEADQFEKLAEQAPGVFFNQHRT